MHITHSQTDEHRDGGMGEGEGEGEGEGWGVTLTVLER